MALKTSVNTPVEVYSVIKRNGAQLLVNVQGLRSQINNTGGYTHLIDSLRVLRRSRQQLNTLKSAPRLGVYAKDQENDAAYDVVAEINAVVAAITAIILWTKNNVPSQVSVTDLATWDGSSSLITETMTAPKKAAILGLFDTLIATMA